MSELRLGSAPVLRARVCVPRFGVWHADLLVDSDAAPSGAVTLATEAGAFSFRGTVVAARTGPYQDRYEVRFVAGAAGLGRVLLPRYYEDAVLRTLLTDLARETGETLSDTISAALLNTSFAKWTRASGPAGTALGHVLGSSGLAWRVLADGTLWVGAETWPNVEIPGDITRESPNEQTREIATDTLYGLLAPGTVWDGRRVSYVEHEIDADRARSIAWFESESATTDRVKSPLEGVVANLARRGAYRVLLAGEVRAQHADLSLDVALDSAEFPELVNVPARGPSPGHGARVATGTRVLVSFAGGLPSAPVVVAFEHAAPNSREITQTAQERVEIDAPEIKLGAAASRGIARADDTVARGAALAQWMLNVETALSGLSAPVTPMLGTTIGAISSASARGKCD